MSPLVVSFPADLAGDVTVSVSSPADLAGDVTVGVTSPADLAEDVTVGVTFREKYRDSVVIPHDCVCDYVEIAEGASSADLAGPGQPC